MGDKLVCSSLPAKTQREMERQGKKIKERKKQAKTECRNEKEICSLNKFE